MSLKENIEELINEHSREKHLDIYPEINKAYVETILSQFEKFIDEEIKTLNTFYEVDGHIEYGLLELKKKIRN